MNRKTLLAGVVCVVVSAICFGTIPLFSQITYRSGIDPKTLLFFRFGIASLCLSALALVQRQSFPIGRNLVWLIGLGSVGFVLQSFCFFSSLTLISGSLATLLVYLYPVFVVCFSLLRGRPIRSDEAVALMLALIGSYLTIGPTIEQASSGAVVGILLALAAAIVYAAYVVIGEKILAQEQAVPSVAIMSAAAARVYGVAGVVQGFTFPTNISGWWAVACIGIVCAAFAIGLLFQGIKLIGSVNASILSNLEPIVTVVIGTAFLGEMLTLEKVLGGLLIVFAGVVLAKLAYQN
ncbi:DMT family transporter [Cyanobacteria bacterium FACHB-502]|nr:DMT family transporter [Cyanobacteria bacterium FACHB-502]